MIGQATTSCFRGISGSRLRLLCGHEIPTFSNTNRITKRWSQIEKTKEQPIKFSTSQANVGYRASLHFYDDDDSGLPPSHNYVLAASTLFGIYYLIFWRDDIENDGGKNLFKPVHDTLPHLAIPMLQIAIAEHRKRGLDASKLEKKLAECMKEPEKYGGSRPRKLVEN